MTEEVEVEKKETPIKDFFKTIFFPFKILWLFFSFILKTVTILIKIFFLTALIFLIIFGYNFYHQFSELKEEGTSREKSVINALDFSIEKAGDYFDIARDKIKFLEIFSGSDTEKDNTGTEGEEESEGAEEENIIEKIKGIVEEEDILGKVKEVVEEKTLWDEKEEQLTKENTSCDIDILEDGSPNVIAICEEGVVGFWYSDKDKDISQMRIKFYVKIPGFTGSQEFPWQTIEYSPKENVDCGFDIRSKSEQPDISCYGEAQLFADIQLIDSTNKISGISSCQIL